jgi:hypothetical protein
MRAVKTDKVNIHKEFLSTRGGGFFLCPSVSPSALFAAAMGKRRREELEDSGLEGLTARLWWPGR